MGFGNDFLWGAASSAHQIEGAYNEDGKSLGIWDALYKGHVENDENAHVSVDHYHHMKEDVALMKEIGLKSYRFSISWPRVIPEQGVVNQKGIDFYNELIDELIAAGIEPMITLFHWNLPMWSHEYGGWKNEQVAKDFADYAKVIAEEFSDRVRFFMTLNETHSFIGGGYVSGVHAPFEKCGEMLPEITRNVLLAHGMAVQMLRKYAKQPLSIGMAVCGDGITPIEESKDAIEVARKETYDVKRRTASIAWWADPMILGVVPEPLKETVTDEDLKVICQPLDFFGYNVYNSNNYDKVEGQPSKQHYPGMPRTFMEWPITPEVLYWMPKFHYERYGLPILVTENGMANNDFVMLDGKVHDPQRIDYIHRYLKNLKRAVDEGIPVLGYQYWSIMDNFEWAEGYAAFRSLLCRL